MRSHIDHVDDILDVDIIEVNETGEDVGLARLSPTGADKAEKQAKLWKQVNEIREWSGDDLRRIYMEIGVSGRKTPPHLRDQFQEMMEYIAETEEIERLVVHHSDRISRSGVPLISIRMVLEAVIGRDIKVYSTIEDKHLKKFDKIRDEADMGEAITMLAQGLASDWEKKKEAMKVEEQIQNKDEDYRPTGRSPPGINTNKTVLDHDSSEFYVPDDEDQFRLAIKILNRYEDHDGTDYQLGKELGIESNRGQTVSSITSNAWKYYQAFRAMHRVEIDPIDTDDVDFVGLVDEPEEVLSPLPQ